MKRKKQIQRFFFALFITAHSLSALAAESECLNSAEYQRLSSAYEDLLSKYDVPTAAQNFLDVSYANQELKEQGEDCLRQSNDVDKNDCKQLTTRYAVSQFQQKAAMSRFNTAMLMQEYMLTLKLKLGRPRCGVTASP